MNKPVMDGFWDWALARYHACALRKQLLLLQDDVGLVIIEALIAAWLAESGYVWSSRDLCKVRRITDEWITDVVIPLRNTRRQWKVASVAEVSRSHLHSLEVEAEHHLAEMMILAIEPLKQIWGISPQPISCRIRENLRILFPWVEKNRESSLDELVALFQVEP